MKDCCNALFGTRTLAQFRDNLGAIDLLEKVGAGDLLAAVDAFWLDREIDAATSWSDHKGDLPENYIVLQR